MAIKYLTPEYWFNRIGYTKAARMELTAYEPLTDEDIERIDIDFARKTREVLRWLGANNPDIASVVNANRLGIIGKAVNIQFRNTKHKETNAPFEAFIKKWSKRKHCELTGRWHFNALCRSMVEFEDKDGGFIVRHHYDTSWEIPYRCELLEIGMIDTSKCNDKERTLNGLKKDKNGRISHVYLYDSQERTTSTAVSADELTYYAPTWISISQYTAVSRLASTMPTIDQLDQYGDAELKAAIERSKAGKYWRTTMYDKLLKIIDAQKEKSVAEQQIGELMRRIKSQGIMPNGLTPIPKEDEIVQGDKQSDSIYSGLTGNSKQNIASAAGMSSQIVYQDPSKSNYSAIKAMMAFASVHWSTRFDDLKELAIDDIIRRAATCAVDIGAVEAPDFHQNPDDYLNIDYMRVSEIDIEPKKTADANDRKLKNKETSLREILAKRGRDVEDVIRERIEEEIMEERIREELYAEAGLTPPTKEQSA